MQLLSAHLVKEIHVFISDLFDFNSSARVEHAKEKWEKELIDVKLCILGVSTVYEIKAEHLFDIIKHSFLIWFLRRYFWLWVACWSTEWNLIYVLKTTSSCRPDKISLCLISKEDSRKNLCLTREFDWERNSIALFTTFRFHPATDLHFVQNKKVSLSA